MRFLIGVVWWIFGISGYFCEEFQAEYGTFSSDDYPAPYPDNINKTWIIIVPKGFVVRLFFTVFDVENSYEEGIGSCVYDYLKVPLGGTDCARPMINAKMKNLKFDCFIIFTDKETWRGKTTPPAALLQYRQKTKLPAKLIVVALTAKEFTVADPNDRGMLDICGFSEQTPRIMSDFISGKF